MSVTRVCCFAQRGCRCNAPETLLIHQGEAKRAMSGISYRCLVHRAGPFLLFETSDLPERRESRVSDAQQNV